MFELFISRPWLALMPAMVFVMLYWRRRRAWTLCAVFMWLAYAAYEQGLKMGALCPSGPGACDLRVDLFLIYPLLGVVSLLAVISAVRRGD